MILMDANFASIVKGIEEGRLIFANLKKSIAYTLTSNIPEIVPFLCQIALRIPLPLTTIMILCIDLGTDMLPAISFAYENPESDIMKQPPRNRHVSTLITLRIVVIQVLQKDKLVTWQLISFSYLQIGVIQAIAAFTVYFYIFQREANISSTNLLNGRYGFEWEENTDHDETELNCSFTNDNGDCLFYDERMRILKHAQSGFLASIVICQIGCECACKTRLNSWYNQGMNNAVLNWGILQVSVLCSLCVLF